MALNPKKVVGLDIGSSVVKAVQLKKVGRTYQLESFGLAEIYPGLDKRTATDRREAKIEAVRRALSDAGISAKFSISAVSGESIIVRYIQLPEMPENELMGAIRWEAEDYIPFPLDEVNLDWMILGRSETGGGGKIDVLLVAAKKELVGDHVSLLRGADLSPAIIDVDSFAFLNCYEANYLPNASEVIALLNLGAEITSISIYVGGVSRFTRDIAVAGDTITSTIQQRLNCSFQRAEELKIKEGIQTASPGEGEGLGGVSLLDTIRDSVERITGEDLSEESPELVTGTVIKSVLGNLANEIKRSIQFFENQPNGKPVQRVAVGGGLSKMSGLANYLEQQLGLPVEPVDVLRNISYSGSDGNKKKLDNIKPQLGVSIGLALRAFE